MVPLIATTAGGEAAVVDTIICSINTGGRTRRGWWWKTRPQSNEKDECVRLMCRQYPKSPVRTTSAGAHGG